MFALEDKDRETLPISDVRFPVSQNETLLIGL